MPTKYDKYIEATTLQEKAEQSGNADQYQRAGELFREIGMHSNAGACLRRAEHYAEKERKEDGESK